MMGRLGRLALTAVAALLGLGMGWVGGSLDHLLPQAAASAASCRKGCGR